MDEGREQEKSLGWDFEEPPSHSRGDSLLKEAEKEQLEK